MEDIKKKRENLRNSLFINHRQEVGDKKFRDSLKTLHVWSFFSCFNAPKVDTFELQRLDLKFKALDSANA